MSKILSLQGVSNPDATQHSVMAGVDASLELEFKQSFSLSGTRDGGEEQTLKVKEDDLILLQMEDGTKLWTRVDQFQTDFPGPGNRGSNPDTLVIPRNLEIGHPSRGVSDWVIKTMSVFGINPSETVAGAIGELAERKLEKPGSYFGLYQCVTIQGDDEANSLHLRELKTDLKLDGNTPILIFIHGTFSNTTGSFGDIWSPSKSGILANLRKQFGNNIFALEHKSLTVSPIQNALDLARALDKLIDGNKLEAPVQLYIVSHSRGGLVGELLARVDAGSDQQGVENEENQPVSEQEISRFLKAGEQSAELADEANRDKVNKTYQAQAKQLAELNDLLDAQIQNNPRSVLNGQRKFTIARFVRAACPARGTNLASGRLDRWANVILNVIGEIPILKVSGIYDAFQSFALAVIKERTQPQSIPGLEAQMPTSPLIRMLNLTQTRINGDLSIISGDVEADSFFGKLKFLIPDLYYRHEHDLVVDTISMDGGTPRSNNQARYIFDQGPEVNHFSYFKNEETAQAMLVGLAFKDENSVYTQLEQQARLLRSSVKAVDGKSPIVYVLPGIMGSHLQVGDNRIWLDLWWDIPTGGMRKLHIDADNVSAEKPMDSGYGRLIEFLQKQNHAPVAFAYDWRLSIEQEARRFAKDLDIKLKLAEPNTKPVHIIAHSMGGLLARMAFAQQPALWNRVVASGGRLLMLGTPNNGAHVIGRTLLGREKTVKMLAAVDLQHNQKQLLEIISRFPGVLNLLPFEHGSSNLFDVKTWEKFGQIDNKKWVLPLETALKNAEDFWKNIKAFSLIHPHLLYVAGKAPATAEDVQVVVSSSGDKEILITGTALGDGRVTWASGIPNSVSTWYLNESHGKLADKKAAFQSYLELITTGDTSQSVLSRDKFIVRGDASASFPMPEEDEVDVLPDQKILLNSIMGSDYQHRKSEVIRPIKIQITHGDLCYASHPVAIGHYQDDALISAENYINTLFENRLRLRMNLGIYPGILNSAAVIINPKKPPNNKPEAALIIGLGEMGKLTQQKLAQTYCHAGIKYAVSTMEKRIQSGNILDKNLKLSSVLVGTGAGGISVEDALLAMIQGIDQANEQLRNIAHVKNNAYCQFVDLEFIDYWQDVVNAAAHAMSTVNPAMRNKIIYEPAVAHGKPKVNPGASIVLKEGGRTRTTIVAPTGWWRRMQINHIEKDGSLKFNALTDKARTEISLQAVDLDQVDQFIQKSIRSPYNDTDISKTLYELLVPYYLKAQSVKQDTVLVLNEKAARYPWELLEDRWAIGHDGRYDQTKSLPFSVQHGIIRQLESTIFRANAISGTDNTALIIGNPQGASDDFSNLPGAENEANSVNVLLSREAYQTTLYLGEDKDQDAQEIISRLHKNAYRIMHFAGHGVYEFATQANSKACNMCGQAVPLSKKVTGMVIGENAFLTPANIESIRFVPELVFINCCHLGREEGHLSLESPHKLAANLATEFIRMGVKAVVATGWAVDDHAAEIFATTFYKQMLSGVTFGKAVLQARKDTYRSDSRINTWGAYQCYGNPDFQLQDSKTSRSSSQRESVSPSELLSDMENLCMDARTNCQNEEDVARLKGKLDKLEANIPLSWRNSEIYQALGKAYAELGFFELAIKYYDSARKCEDANVSLHSMEQLANIKAKYALQLHRETSDKSASLKLITSAISTLNELLKLGETSERQSLLASTYKRKAWIQVSNIKSCNAALEKMHVNYARACEQKPGDIYALFNKMTAEAIIDWRENKSGTARSIKLRNQLKDFVASKPDIENPDDFWQLVEHADLNLLRYLVFYDEKGNKDKHNFVNKETLARDYKQAFQRAGSPKEISSVTEHIAFLVVVLRPDNGNSQAKTTMIRRGEMVGELLELLRSLMQTV